MPESTSTHQGGRASAATGRENGVSRQHRHQFDEEVSAMASAGAECLCFWQPRSRDMKSAHTTTDHLKDPRNQDKVEKNGKKTSTSWSPISLKSRICEVVACCAFGKGLGKTAGGRSVNSVVRQDRYSE